MKISVKAPRGDLLTFEVALDDKIDDVKTKIHRKTGIKPQDQMLIFRARNLEGNRTIADYALDRILQPLYLVAKPAEGTSGPNVPQMSRNSNPRKVEDQRSMFEYGLQWAIQSFGIPVSCWPDTSALSLGRL